MNAMTRHPFRPAVPGPARPWQQTLAMVQEHVAVRFNTFAADGCIDRATLAQWMATESALCRINANALDAIGAWFDAQPATLHVVRTWADALRRDAGRAADDVRALGGIAGPTLRVLADWQAFMRLACGSLRAGEAIGAIVLPGRALRGPAREAVARIIAMPDAAGATRYLQRRLLPDAQSTHDARAVLFGMYASSALASGAQRAAGWYATLLDEVFQPTLPSSV